MPLRAITRLPSRHMDQAQLTHLARVSIDLALAGVQHAAYRAALVAAGVCAVAVMDAADTYPDCCFVEDTALILPEVAVLCRPGAPSRLGEVAAMAAALTTDRPVVRIVPPGTLDGGDVLKLGRCLFVGQSARSNAAGIADLAGLLAPYDYRVVPVPVAGALHLKTAAARLPDGRVLVNPDWVDATVFGAGVIPVDAAEAFAANALAVGQTVIYPARFARTATRLEAEAYTLLRVDTGEFAKAEGGVTCLSIVYDVA